VHASHSASTSAIRCATDLTSCGGGSARERGCARDALHAITQEPMVRFDTRRVCAFPCAPWYHPHAHATEQCTLPVLLSGCLTQRRCGCW